MNSFVQFANSHGLIIDHLVHGRIARCKTTTHRSKRNGAYYFAGQWGWCQNWQTDDEITIWQDGTVQPEEIQKQIKQSKEKHAKDRAKSNAAAAKKARLILSQCKQELHSYLHDKGFSEMCGNVWFKSDSDPVLVVPMFINKTISGCQLIDVHGGKKFLSGQASKGAYFQIGSGRQVFFVEGYASALSLQKILASLKISYRIVVCFSAGNLLNLAKCTSGFVIADNDESKAGESAAIDSGCNWWMPPTVGQDINDYHRQAGVFKVSQELKKVLFNRS